MLFAKEQMSDRPFFALYKRATKRAIALSLFQKERQKEQLLFRSFKKSDKKSDRSFALSKRAKEQKMSDFPNRSFFAQKKERSLIFKMSECPTLILRFKNYNNGRL